MQLVSDIWMPTEEGQYPVIMIRTPYGRSNPQMNYTGMGEYFARQGYVFMVQDVRGKGDSPGDFGFLFQEGQDGYDSIEWAANQSWSNGRVGMMGFDYMGTDQWLAAREKPPHLVCIAPTAATGRYMEEVPPLGEFSIWDGLSPGHWSTTAEFLIPILKTLTGLPYSIIGHFQRQMS